MLVMQANGSQLQVGLQTTLQQQYFSHACTHSHSLMMDLLMHPHGSSSKAEEERFSRANTVLMLSVLSTIILHLHLLGNWLKYNSKQSLNFVFTEMPHIQQTVLIILILYSLRGIFPLCYSFSVYSVIACWLILGNHQLMCRFPTSPPPGSKIKTISAVFTAYHETARLRWSRYKIDLICSRAESLPHHG